MNLLVFLILHFIGNWFIFQGFKNVHDIYEYSVKKKYYEDNDDKEYHSYFDKFDDFFKNFKANNLEGVSNHVSIYVFSFIFNFVINELSFFLSCLT